MPASAAAAYVLATWLTRSAPVTVRAAIAAQYATYSKAYCANDVKTLLSILSADYVIHASDGSTIPMSQYAMTLDERQRAGVTVGSYEVVTIAVFDHPAKAHRDETADVWSKETTIAVGDPSSRHVHIYLDTWDKEFGTWRLTGTTTLMHGK